MNMKVTMILAMIAGVAIADTPVLPLTIEFRARTCPGLEVYSANQRVLDVTIKDGLTKYDYTGRTPVMWWSPSNNQTNLSGVVMAEISNTNPTNGTFRATWSPSNLNTNGNFWYGVGITTYGVVTTARIGEMRIIYDPYASGVSPVSFGKSLNWGTITQYLGTATYGPYRAGSGLSASANADGSVTLTAPGLVASENFATNAAFLSVSNAAAGAYPSSNPSNFCTLAAAAMLTNGFIKAGDIPVDDLSWTNKPDASITNTLASTGYVAGVVAGYLPTSTVFVAAESDTNALMALSSYTNLILSAWQNPPSATNFQWVNYGDHVILTNYTGPSDVIIPDELDGLPVTGFSLYDIFRFSDITSISGGNNIHIIGGWSFAECHSLTNVSLLHASRIENSAFFECSSLTHVTFDGECAPSIYDPWVFLDSNILTIYVRNPTATGWGETLGGRPVVRLPLYGSGASLTGITAAQVGASPTGHVHGVDAITNLPATPTLTSLGGVTNTQAGIAAAGGVTNAVNDPVLSVYNLSGLSVNSTCTLTRAWGNAFRIAPTATVYFAADTTLTDTNTEAGFTLDLFYNAQTFGFVTASMTNTATLVSNAWNNIIFWKGYGSSVFVGR